MAVDPVTFGAAVTRVLGWFGAIDSRPTLTRAQRRQVESAGYTRAPRGLYRDPQGNVIGARDAWRAVSAIIPPVLPAPTVPPTVPLPTPEPPFRMPPGGTGPKYENPVSDRAARQAAEEFKRRRNPPRQPPPPIRRPPIIDPNLPYEVTARSIPVLLRVLGAVGGLLYPSPTSSTDTILGRPPGSQRGPTQRPRIRPRPDDQVLPTPAPPAAPLPGPTPQPPAVDVPLEVPQIWQQPIPQPTPTPTPTASPTSSPTSSPTTSSPFDPLWLAPLPLLTPSRFTDPLTPTNPLTPSSPQPGAPPRTPPPKFPTPGLTPFQPPGLGSRPSQSDRCKPCDCERPRKKKRKKRKPRAVCYSGTFTETKSSTLKVRRRKIPCR